MLPRLPTPTRQRRRRDAGVASSLAWLPVRPACLSGMPSTRSSCRRRWALGRRSHRVPPRSQRCTGYWRCTAASCHRCSRPVPSARSTLAYSRTCARASLTARCRRRSHYLQLSPTISHYLSLSDSSLQATVAAAGLTGLLTAPVTQPFVTLKVYQQVSPTYPRLQPYVSQAATLCIPGCNPMYPRLQPYASQARGRVSDGHDAAVAPVALPRRGRG